MKKTPYLTLLLTCGIVLVGCIDDPDLNTPEAVPIIVDDSLYVYYSKLPQAEFLIEDGEIIKDILKLSVSYSGGCGEHEFGLIASKGIAKDNPPIGYMLLTHDAHADTCRAEMNEVLLFDLTPYRKHLQSSGLLESGTVLLPINNGLGQFLAQFEYCF